MVWIWYYLSHDETGNHKTSWVCYDLLGHKRISCLALKWPLILVIATSTPIPWNALFPSKVAILWSTLSQTKVMKLSRDASDWRISSTSSVMTTPCLKRLTSLYDCANPRLNSWVLSHLDANIWLDSIANSITDLDIAALMTHCPIVSSFSSERMNELKKRIWDPTYFNVSDWWRTCDWSRRTWLQKLFQFVFDNLQQFQQGALLHHQRSVFCCHTIDHLLSNQPCC